MRNVKPDELFRFPEGRKGLWTLNPSSNWRTMVCLEPDDEENLFGAELPVPEGATLVRVIDRISRPWLDRQAER
jgi:hypothetical protein